MADRLKKLFHNSARDQKAFDRIFKRQPDNYSCAAAACVTIARLYGRSTKLSEAFFRKSLKTGFSGSFPADIGRSVREHLGGTDEEFVPYKGGIALGNIRHKPEGDSHAVVFLAQRGQTLVYYDPIDHKIYRDNLNNIALPDEHKKLHALHLPALQDAGFDFWRPHAEQNPYPLKKQHFYILEQKKAERNKRRRAAYAAQKRHNG